MGFPRDYLQFTTWYLRNKGYITQADNSDFTLTALGVDFVESNNANIPVLNRLLTTGSGPTVAPEPEEPRKILTPPHTPIIVPPSAANVAPGGNGASDGSGAKKDETV